jgi:hypothetical protein
VHVGEVVGGVVGVKWQLSGSYRRLGQYLTLSSQGAKIAPTPIDCGGTPTNPRIVLWGRARLVGMRTSCSMPKVPAFSPCSEAQKINTAFVSQSRNRSYRKCKNGIFCEATSRCCYHHRRWRDWRVIQYHHCLLINTHSTQALVPL